MRKPNLRNPNPLNRWVAMSEVRSIMNIATEHKAAEPAILHPHPQGYARNESPAQAAKRPGTSRKEDAVKRSTIGLVVILSVTVIVVTTGIAALATVVGKPDATLIYYSVKRTDLPITVVERGNLESQVNLEIICEVDDIHGDGIDGTPILWIIPNGTSVKEGDLIVELDSASHQERLDRQILDTERARAHQIQAKARYKNRITQNQTAEQEARLQVKLVELELEMFVDKDNGTYKLEVEELKRQIDDINNEVLAAQANLELRKNEELGIESLFKLGYAGKSELDRTRLGLLQAESQYAARMNRLSTQLATLEKKQTYDHRMQLLQLKGNVETRRRRLDQVILNNASQLEQARAATEAADRALKKEEERLARYRKQLENCQIFAPQSGMVAYAVSNSRWRKMNIGEGVPIRHRQPILSLPNLTRMQVKTAVHESVLNQIKKGLPATVSLDAFPDRSYKASVTSVAVLPDQGGWTSSGTKVYETIVTIDEDVEHLKPGMTAVVEIHVDRLKDVLSVPVQAIVQRVGDSWCYVEAAGVVERRILKLGRSNDKFVEISDGLLDDDRVVLNPMAIVDEALQSESSNSANDHSRSKAEGA